MQNMEIYNSEEGLTISGPVRMAAHKEIAEAVAFIAGNVRKEISITFRDAPSLPSTCVGLFLNLRYEKGLDLSLRVHNKQLYNLLDALELVPDLNVRYEAQAAGIG